jgi:hypothetical protein
VGAVHFAVDVCECRNKRRVSGKSVAAAHPCCPDLFALSRLKETETTSNIAVILTTIVVQCSVFCDNISRRRILDNRSKRIAVLAFDSTSTWISTPARQFP